MLLNLWGTPASGLKVSVRSPAVCSGSQRALIPGVLLVLCYQGCPKAGILQIPLHPLQGAAQADPALPAMCREKWIPALLA